MRNRECIVFERTLDTDQRIPEPFVCLWVLHLSRLQPIVRWIIPSYAISVAFACWNLVNSSRMCCVELALFYKNPDLICHSENIPPMLKGIAFNEESKSQPKRGGLWLRKRNFRTLDFDLEKGYWILLIQLLLLSIFNILIDVGSCWNRDSFFTFFLWWWCWWRL